MLRKFTVLLSLILTLGFAFTTTAVAQDAPDIETPDLEGLESGYARMFMPDFSAMLDAIGTPGAEVPEFDEDGVMMVMTAILTFDSDENAQKSMDMLAKTYAEQQQDMELTPEDIDDLGDKAVLYAGEVKSGDGMTMATNILVVQESERLFMVMVGGGEMEAGSTQATTIVQYMLDTEPETDEVIFNSDGTSTGGAFDRMPTAEETDMIEGLVPFMDVDYAEQFGGN